MMNKRNSQNEKDRFTIISALVDREFKFIHFSGSGHFGWNPGVAIGEKHTFLGNAIDVRCLITHQAVSVTTEVRLTDIIPPDNHNVGFLIIGHD